MKKTVFSLLAVVYSLVCTASVLAQPAVDQKIDINNGQFFVIPIIYSSQDNKVLLSVVEAKSRRIATVVECRAPNNDQESLRISDLIECKNQLGGWYMITDDIASNIDRNMDIILSRMVEQRRRLLALQNSIPSGIVGAFMTASLALNSSLMASQAIDAFRSGAGAGKVVLRAGGAAIITAASVGTMVATILLVQQSYNKALARVDSAEYRLKEKYGSIWKSKINKNDVSPELILGPLAYGLIKDSLIEAIVQSTST